MDKEPIKSMSEWEIYRHKNRPDIRYYVQADIAGGVVRLKATKNIAFDKDKEDFPVSMAPEAGVWPAREFFELYEKEEARSY